MSLKYKVFWISLLSGVMGGFGGYFIRSHWGVYLMLCGILLFVFSFAVLAFVDAKDKSLSHIILKAMLFNSI